MARAKAKPARLGIVWPVAAILYGPDMREKGRCMDTPNAIAKALMEMPGVAFVRPGVIAGRWTSAKLHDATKYAGRMAAWNVAESHLLRGST